MAFNNTCIFIGRLTADPIVRYAQNESGTAVARYSIAVDRTFKRDGDPDADFFNCTCFGKQAEFVEKYFRKGIKVIVKCHAQNNKYTNKDGQEIRDNQYVVDEQGFAESKSAAHQNANGPIPMPSGNAPTDLPPSSATQTNLGDFMSISADIEEELPFK